jgi:probable selenium-dependent hydroxylase accessory protein YqeC
VSGLVGPLRIGRGDVVAVAGAGGKTTLIYRVAAEARAAGLRVLVTTTTHMATLPEATTGPVVVEAGGDAGSAIEHALSRVGLATLIGRRVRPDKLEGVPPERVDVLAARADLVLVEADGARGRSLKTPAAHEPVVPLSTTLLVVLAALDALGQPLAEAHVHRLDRVAAAAGREPGSAIDEDVIVSTLCDPTGYPARRRPGLRAAIFLNKAEAPAALEAAARIARRLVPPYEYVVAGSARAGTARPMP